MDGEPMSNRQQQLFQAQRLTALPHPAALPLGMRVIDRLTEVLILSDELLAEFQTEDASQLRWLEPHIRRVYDDVDQAMRRLAQ
jgi:hypothetical protein